MDSNDQGEIEMQTRTTVCGSPLAVQLGGRREH
jgi:hypothetical protein